MEAGRGQGQAGGHGAGVDRGGRGGANIVSGLGKLGFDSSIQSVGTDTNLSDILMAQIGSRRLDI